MDKGESDKNKITSWRMTNQVFQVYPLTVRSQCIFVQRSPLPSKIIHIMKKKSYIISVCCFYISQGKGVRDKIMSGFTKKGMALNHSIHLWFFSWENILRSLQTLRLLKDVEILSKMIITRSFHPFLIHLFHHKTQESTFNIWENELKVFVTLKVFSLWDFQIFLVIPLLFIDFTLHLETTRRK